MDWTKAPGDTVVCESCGLTLRDIVKAIAFNDAETVEDVISASGDCPEDNFQDCSQTIQDILDIYVPIYSSLKSGCGGG